MVKQYLLDTNVLIDMFKGNQRVQERIFRAEFHNCCISEITLAELYVGAFKGGRPKQLQEIQLCCIQSSPSMFHILSALLFYKGKGRTFFSIKMHYWHKKCKKVAKKVLSEAKAINEHRRNKGDLHSFDELSHLEGFRPTDLDRLRPYIEF